MADLRLDHVNLSTARLDVLRAFYVEVLGLREGARPPSSKVGTWLYAGPHPVVHLVEDLTATSVTTGSAGGLSHFAFTSVGRVRLEARLSRKGVPFEASEQPSEGVVRVRLRDPDGNELHVDFRVHEEPQDESDDDDENRGDVTASRDEQTCGQELADAAEVPARWAALMNHVALNIDEHAAWVGTASHAAALEHDGMRAVAASYRGMAEAARQTERVMKAMVALPPAPHDPAGRNLVEQCRWMEKKIELQRELARVLLSHVDESEAALRAWRLPTREPAAHSPDD